MNAYGIDTDSPDWTPFKPGAVARTVCDRCKRYHTGECDRDETTVLLNVIALETAQAVVNYRNRLLTDRFEEAFASRWFGLPTERGN